MTQITKNFTLQELTHSQTAARKGVRNIPHGHSHEYKNLQRTAEVMELVRTILGGKPILISSGYRSREVNEAVGGSTGSAHIQGLAVDFTCPGFGAPLDICEALEPHMRELGVDQLIVEYSQWVHLGLTSGDPRHQCLTIDTKGTRQGFA